MRRSYQKIKSHPKWEYGENAFPSPYERTIVAGCGQAVEQLQTKIEKLERAIDYITDHAWVSKDAMRDDHFKWINEFVEVAKKARDGNDRD
jgi:hypothetical protein